MTNNLKELQARHIVGQWRLNDVASCAINVKMLCDSV